MVNGTAQAAAKGAGKGVIKMTKKNVHSRAYHRALGEAKSAGLEEAKAKEHARNCAAKAAINSLHLLHTS